MSQLTCPNVECGRVFADDGKRTHGNARCPSCGSAFPAPRADGGQSRLTLRDLVGRTRPEPRAATPSRAAAARTYYVFSCARCQKEIRAVSGRLAANVVCPKCGQGTAVPPGEHLAPAARGPGARVAVPSPRKHAPPPAPSSPATAEPPQVRFRCGGCGRVIRAPLHQMGKSATCPQCRRPLIVGQNRVDALAPEESPLAPVPGPPPLPPRRVEDEPEVEAIVVDLREAERRAAEQAARAEAERKAAEEATRREAERKAAEEAARREAERKAAEEAARLEAERRAAEEAARLEAERRAAEEAARLEAERKAAEEAAHLEAERKAAEEAARLRAEREAVEEAARLEAERRAAEEAAEEAQREAAKEVARLEAEQRAAEEAAIADAERLEAECREAQRKAEEESARLEAELRAAEEATQREAERRAVEEAARLEAEHRAAEEAARLEAERKAAEEAARLEAERKAAEEAARHEAEERERQTALGVVAGQIAQPGSQVAGRVQQAGTRPVLPPAPEPPAVEPLAVEPDEEAPDDEGLVLAPSVEDDLTLEDQDLSLGDEEEEIGFADESAVFVPAGAQAPSVAPEREESEIPDLLDEEELPLELAVEAVEGEEVFELTPDSAVPAARLPEPPSPAPAVAAPKPGGGRPSPGVAAPAPAAAPARRKDDFGLPEFLDAVQKGEIRVNRLGTVPSRMLMLPLGCPILGQEVSADVYGTSAFRLLGLPACASTSEVDSAVSRLKMVSRLRPDAARQGFLQIGYDGHVGLEEPLKHLDQLQDPRQRILREVFWLHVAPQVFEPIRTDRQLISRSALRRLQQTVENTGDRTSILAKHAMAVLLHNAAIAEELGYGTGLTDNPAVLWKKSLAYWAEVLRSEHFWDYLRYRVDVLDDPRLRREDVDEIRAQLPGLILGFHRMFARAYASTGQNAACNTQLAMIAKSDFQGAARNTALVAAVQAVTTIRLEPLVRRAEDAYGEDQPGKDPVRIARSEFDRRFGPILEEALTLRDYLINDLHIDINLVALAEFDRLATILMNAANRRIDYSTDDRLRAILRSILTARRLLRLPLSASQRRKLEKNIHDDTEAMYKNLGGLPEGQDPAQCWFLGGEEADPDASLELPLYKITKVDGASVQWECRRVFIPRSATARNVHTGRATAAQLAASRNDETARRIRGDIEKARAEAAAQVQAIEREATAEVAKEQAALQARLDQFNHQAADQEQRDKQAVADGEARLGAKLRAEESRRNQACAAVQQKYQQPLSEAQSEFAESSRGYRGLSQFHVFELPTLGAVFVALLLLEMVLSAAGAFTLRGHYAAVFVVNGILALGAGFGVGAVIRKTILKQLKSRLNEVTRQRDYELAQVQGESRKIVEAARAAAEQELRAHRARLADVEKRRGAIRSEGQTRIQTLQNAAKQKSDQIQRAANTRISAWEQELASRVQVKPESAKFQFPLYVQAKRNGYSDGERPSQAEMERIAERAMREFMDSLADWERVLLARMAQVLSNQQFAELLGRLAGMSVDDRRRFLRSMF